MRSPLLALACAGVLALASPARAQLLHDTGVAESPADVPTRLFDATGDDDTLLPDEVAPDDALWLTPRRMHGDVPYVIVTRRRLAPVFVPFAAWKSHTGTRAAIRTTEWIDRHYAGRDGAERVRAFLQDAHARWGTRWLLVGGDSTVVPMRLASIVPLSPQLPDVVPTDWYYACLDGDWDGNRNGRFGEFGDPSLGIPGDSADVAPELHVGRAPVTTRAEARAFLRRTRAAFAPAEAGFARSTLLAGGALGPQIPFAPLLEPLREPLEAAGRDVRRLYEFPSQIGVPAGADSCSPAALLQALSDGPALAVLGFASGPDGLSTRNGGVNVPLADLGAVSNGLRRGHYAMVGSSACMPAGPGIARTLLSAPEGGAASFYGPTHVAFLNAGSQLVNDYVRRVATGGTTLGEASSSRPAHVLQYGTGDGYGWVLFGDPQLRVPMPPPPVARTLRTPRATTASPGTEALAFAAPLASPARGPVRVAWTAREGASVDVDVFDVTGRRVAALARGAVAPTRDVTWDLRDESGARVSAGVYLVRAAGAGRVATQRVVVLP